jgi:4,5-epoxidase
VLDRLGALGELPDRGLPVRQVVVTVEGRALARLQVGLPMERLGARAGLIMSQAEIEGALRDRLAAIGGSVEWGRCVTGLAGRPNGVTVRLDDGTDVEAGWVVGADGAHSIVRKTVGVGFPGVPLIERFLLADVHADLDRPRHSVFVWLRRTEVLAAFPLPGTDLWRVMATGPRTGPARAVRRDNGPAACHARPGLGVARAGATGRGRATQAGQGSGVAR